MSDGFTPDDGFTEDTPPSAPKRPEIGFGTKALNMIGRGAWSLPGLVGLDHESVQGFLGAIEDPAGLGGSFSDRARAYKDAALRTSRRVDEENPVTSGLVRGAAAAPGEALLWMAAPEAKLAQGASALEKALTYGPRFATTGAATEYGSTAHKDPAERAVGALEAGATAALAGGGMAAALPNPAVLMPRPSFEPAPPRVETSPAARTLQAAGVDDLTTGQLLPPEHALSQIERASAGNVFGVAPQRAASRESFMRTAQNKGAAPGAEIPATPDLQARLGELFEGFDPAYAAIKERPIPPEAITSLPDVAMTGVPGIDAATRKAVRNEVGNALTVLPGVEWHPPGMHGGVGSIETPWTYRPGPAGQFGKAPVLPQATAGDLLKVRENLRASVRAARDAQDFDRLRLLGSAEDVVTDALERALTPEQAAHLRATDRQYARLMTAANAAPPGQTEFTPLQYLKQVERSAGRRNFKKGEAGDLQDLGEAGREVFAEAPFTGWPGNMLSMLGPGAKYAAAPAARLFNSAPFKEFLFSPRVRTTTAGAPSTPAALGSEATLESLAAFLRSLGLDVRAPASAVGEEGERQ